MTITNDSYHEDICVRVFISAHPSTGISQYYLSDPIFFTYPGEVKVINASPADFSFYIPYGYPTWFTSGNFVWSCVQTVFNTPGYACFSTNSPWTTMLAPFYSGTIVESQLNADGYFNLYGPPGNGPNILWHNANEISLIP
ncbi:hypothetical protein DNU06_04100 [Putridiphycobacter roseus]|uniref:Uncharacterized protein n=1 Tax=Putridiphycobacter roseus TaxID=2219161 RepID=A0A2W1MZZ0_9FLAO|nr:hypothetical protein [Putridiphycobacter roseus]PZE17809.1 hypothetical protein DNU06_04100 [Putridiphycobacter roseus]